MNRLKKFLRDVVLTIAAFPLVALWLLVLNGMFSPESLIVFVMALREVDADQLAGLMRSAVHIWIALSIVLALAKLVARHDWLPCLRAERGPLRRAGVGSAGAGRRPWTDR